MKFIPSLNRNPGFSSFMFCVIAIIICSCTENKPSVQEENWGTYNGKQVLLYTMTNSNGMVFKLTNYGGIITSILTPDKNGELNDVVLGFDNLEQYTGDHPCFGATIGRFANRIRNAQFAIGDSIYHLEKNDGEHCLHGAREFDRVVWESKIVENELGPGIQLHYLSKDGEKGFPGNLDSYVTYSLTDDNAIHIKYEATTDKATHVNMTQHSYFNLNGVEELIYDHQFRVDADTYQEIDTNALATGKLLPLEGTPWDLKELTRVGDKIKDIPLNGYHHCYVLNKPENELAKVAEVIEPKSGRTLDVYTTQPGVVLYASNGLGSDIVGKKGIRYGPHAAFCIETQDYIDAPNYPEYPSTLLLPGEKYEEIAIYDFGVLAEK